MEGSQLIDGKFQPVRDVCTKHAEDVFNSRRGIDTNPMIVQMIHHDKPVNHHYYRSDQWIDQPYKKSPDYAPP